MARIIVADNSAFMRNEMRKILSQIGHEIIEEANDANSVIQKCRGSRPDILMLDVSMPGLPSVQIVKDLIQIEPNMIIIMCTLPGQSKLAQQGMRVGAKGICYKPYENNEVQTEINRVLDIKNNE